MDGSAHTLDAGIQAKKTIYGLCVAGQCIGHFSLRGDARPGETSIVWEGFTQKKFEQLFVTGPTGAPMFLENLAAENEFIRRFLGPTQAHLVDGSLRFLSNTVISEGCPHDRPVVFDTLGGQLRDFIDPHTQTIKDRYQGPSLNPDDPTFLDQLREILGNLYTSRVSGAENKIPCFMDEDGLIRPAVHADHGFTHILKLPGTDARAGWPVNEWMCLELLRATGQDVSECALVEIDGGFGFLSERFDIPRSNQAITTGPFNPSIKFPTFKFIMDFLGTARLGVDMKGKGSIEQIAKVMREGAPKDKKLETDNRSKVFDQDNPNALPEDLIKLFRRTFTSWLVNDLDMHRKNISLLMEFDPETGTVLRRRFAPIYDVTSEIFTRGQGVEAETTLTVNGRKNKISFDDFLKLATTLGIDETQAKEIMQEDAQHMVVRALKIIRQPPAPCADSVVQTYTVMRIASILKEKINQLWPEDCAKPSGVDQLPDVKAIDPAGNYARDMREQIDTARRGTRPNSEPLAPTAAFMPS